MKKQGGFTLIELVIVIVVLGILSAFALPQFVNLSDRATNAVVQGAAGSAKSANALVHAAYLAEANPAATVINTRYGDIDLQHGFPAVDDGTNRGILAASGIGAPDYLTVTNAGGDTVSVTASTAQDGSDCFVYSAAADSNSTSTITAGTWNDADGDGVFADGECSI